LDAKILFEINSECLFDGKKDLDYVLELSQDIDEENVFFIDFQENIKEEFLEQTISIPKFEKGKEDNVLERLIVFLEKLNSSELSVKSFLNQNKFE
jgi:hypothetical protein